MKALTLLYHDVIASDDPDASGFPGTLAARYKLSAEAFERHLDAVARGVPGPVGIRYDDVHGTLPAPTLLTFDDGGASAVAVGEGLARRGWKAHFFVTTDRIGTPSFLEEDDIRALDAMGHVVGSHTASHPDRMSECTWAELVAEWSTSVEVLSEVLGKPVSVGSVAGGYSSPSVIAAAASAGMGAVFTSEPTLRVRAADGCRVFGRFAIINGTSAAAVERLVSGAAVPRLQQFTSWNTKKLAKAVGGESYLAVRRALLRSR